MKMIAVMVAALALSGCNKPANWSSPQENLDRGKVACRGGVTYLYINNSTYSSSWVIPLDVQGRPYPCSR